MHTKQDEFLDARLFEAIKSKNLNKIKSLIANGANLAAKNQKGYTPIQFATNQHLIEGVDVIASCKPTDSNDSYGYGYVLVRAARNDEVNTVVFLLAANAPINSITKKDNNSALHWAVINKNTPLIRYLVEKGADLSAVNKDNLTPLYLAALLGLRDWAVKNKKPSVIANIKNIAPNLSELDETTIVSTANDHPNYWDCVNTLLECKNQYNSDSKTYNKVLYHAIIANQLKTVTLLLNSGDDWSMVMGGVGNSQFHEAVIINNPKLIQLLLQHKLHPFRTNKNGLTPLELACERGHWTCAELLIQTDEAKKFMFKNKARAGLAFVAAVKAGRLTIAQMLFEAGASISEKTKPCGNTCLHWVVKEWDQLNNNMKAVQWVLSLGFNQSAVNSEDKTAIELASELGHWNLLQLLIEHEKNLKNAPMRVQALHLEQALIHTIKQGNYTLTELLLENGAPCNSKNSEMGNIALYWAMVANQDKIMELLLTFGANYRFKNKFGQNTLEMAIQCGQLLCLQLLEAHEDNAFSKTTTSFLKSASLNPEFVERKRHIAMTLFDSLRDASFEIKNIPTVIKDFRACFKTILEHDRAYFLTQRTLLKTQSTHNAIDTINSQDSFSALIQLTNQLLQKPHSKPQLTFALNPYSAEESDIQYYLDCAQAFDMYTTRARAFLIELKAKLRQVTDLKSHFDLWVSPLPEPVECLQTTLSQDKLTPTTSSDVILETFSKATACLYTIQALTQLDIEMKRFLVYAFDYLASMTFLVNYGPNTKPTESTVKTIIEPLPYPLATVNEADTPQYVPVFTYTNTTTEENTTNEFYLKLW